MEKSSKYSLAVGLVVMAKFLAGLSGLLTTFFLVRLIDKADMGALRFWLMVAHTTAWVMAAGIPQSVLYFVPQTERRHRKAVCWQNVLLLCLAGLLGGVLIVAIEPVLQSRFDDSGDLGTGILLLAAFFFMELPSRSLDNILIAMDRHRAASAVMSLFSIAQLAGTVVPAALGLGLKGVLWGVLASGALRLGATVGALLWIFRGEELTWWRKGLREQLAYAIPLGLSGIVGYVNQLFDKYLVAFVFNALVFAEYEAGAYQLPLVSVLPYTVASVLLPKLVEKIKAGGDGPDGSREAMAMWHTSMVKVALVMLPVFAFLVMTAEDLVVLLYTEDYVRAAIPFRIYLFLLPVRVTAYGIVLQAYGRTKPIFAMSVISFATNAALSIALVLTIGLPGAPAATVVAQYVGIFYMLVWIKRLSGSTLAGLLPWKGYLRVAAVAAVSAAPTLVVGALAPLPRLPLFLVQLAVYVASYLAIGSATGVISRQDRRYVRDLVTFGSLTSRSRDE